MPPLPGVPVHIILHAFSLLVVALCVTVMNTNYQRSPKTEQIVTAEKSGNALKQGVEHTQSCVSAVGNCKNTRLYECLVD